jgi:homocysteine S-methyltransferase
LLPLVKTLAQSSPIPVFALPNAGFPTVDHGIATYHLDPAYLVRFAAAYLEAGVALIGGCCGVGPAHIAALVEAHAGSSVVGTGNQTVARSSATMALRPNPFIATLGGDAFPVLAMVPGHLESRVAARTLGELAEAGADAIGLLAGWPGAGGHSPNLPARLRHLRDACSKPAILELPAASVSLAEAQAALRDAHLLGIDLVLIDVGVFSGMAGQPGSGADPARLVQLVADCNRGIDLGGVRLAEPTTFAIGVRLGVDDLDLAETLAQAGAQFCTLQPVYESKRFRDALAAYAADLPLLAEILVLPDADTAEELDAEVPVLSLGIGVIDWPVSV